MTKRIKKPIICCVSAMCVLVLLFSFSGCIYKGYSGKRQDLYTVAINSVLWNLGHSYSTERVQDSEIEILEEDNFGRTLFQYRERYYSGGDLSFSALIVSQQSVESYVYYYEDLNYLIKEQKAFGTPLQKFTEQEKQHIKAINDWGADVDLGKCVKKQISKYKTKMPEAGKGVKKEAVSEFNLADGTYNIFTDFLTFDSDNNFIVYGKVDCYASENIYFVAIVKASDNSISWFIPSDLYNYQIEFRNFKNENGWKN